MMERPVQHLPRHMSGMKERAVDRLDVELNGLLRFQHNPELPVRITNLSSRGFRCRATATLDIGSTIILRLPGLGQYSATVAWQLGREAGARFDAPLPLSTVMKIVLPALPSATADES